MKTIIFSFALMLAALGSSAQPGSITNIQVSQGTDDEERLINIQFDLTGSAAEYDISLEVSFDNGITFSPIAPVEITGSLSVAPGTGIQLVWDGRQTYGTVYAEMARIRIRLTSRIDIKYKLDIDVNPEGAGTVTGDGEYIEGEEVVLTATANEGWEFVNWTGDTGYVDDPDAASTTVTIPAQDVTLTANFEEKDTEVMDVINPTTGKTWMDRNLGANRVATSSADAEAYGDLYQWGRAADGHQIRTSGTTTVLSGSDTPGHGNFILTGGDWRSPRNDNLWQGVSGVNNPCPTGYRLPSEAELNDERLSWVTNNAAGAFASPLKLPIAGYRYRQNGSLGDVGSQGRYWSSGISSGWSLALGLYSGNADLHPADRGFGFSVRCLKD